MSEPVSRRSFLGTAAGAGLGLVSGALTADDALAQERGRVARPDAGQAGAAPGAADDLVLVNGRIHTLDARNTVANSVTIRRGRIMSVGTPATPGAQAARGARAAASAPGTRVIDLRGRTVVPGIIETHLHGLDTADRPGCHVLELESAATIREVQEMLAGQAKDVPQGQWLTAIGAANPNLWAEHRFPTLRELDDAVPDRPVFLYQGFNGPAVTNSLGKRFFDAADAGPSPHPDYVPVRTSATGEIGVSTAAMGGPSMSALYLLRRLQTFDDRKRNALRTANYSTSVGVTTWLDKSTIYSLAPLNPRQGSAAVDPYRLRDPWNAVHGEGKLPMRVHMDFTCFAERDDNAMLKAYLRNALPDFGDDMFRNAGIGEWPAPAAEVAQTRAAQRLVAEAGWRCDNDAGSAAALALLVDQLESLNRDVDITRLRWNVNLLGNGVGWVTTLMLDRLHALNCSIQLAANNWVNSRDASVVVGHAFRTIAQHPIRKSLFSNATHISPLNPWRHLHFVVTGLNTYDQQVNPGESLTREDALRLRTRESAWHLKMEDRLGTIEPDRLADLVVLDRDYFTVPEAEIRRIRAVMTIVDGKVVHGA